MLIFAAILLFPIVYAQDTSIGQGAAVKVTLVNQDPDPVDPGSATTVRFKIENIGSANAEDLVFEILPEYPFTLDSSESAVRDVGSIWGRQKGDLGAIVKYKIKADESASQGITEISARYKTKKLDWTKVGPFNISVQSAGAVLAVRSVQLVPETVAPGGKVNVTISLQNTAKTQVRNVNVKLDLTATPSFVPVGYSEKTLEFLSGGQKADVHFEIISQPETTVSAYRIPVLITYSDDSGNGFSRNGTLGVIVGSKPELLVQMDTSTIYTRNSAGEVSIKFINRGLGDIKFLTVKLLQSPDYKLLSSDTVYIGKVSSDDYEGADFRLYAYSDTVQLPLAIEYSDANNNKYSEQRILSFPTYSSEDLAKFGIQKSGGNGLLIFIVVIVLGIIAFQAWSRLRKKK